MKNFQKAVTDCDTCLKMEPSNVKALIRKGQALVGLQNYNEAVDVFEDVLDIEPENSIANQELFNLRKIVAPRNAFR